MPVATLSPSVSSLCRTGPLSYRILEAIGSGASVCFCADVGKMHGQLPSNAAYAARLCPGAIPVVTGEGAFLPFAGEGRLGALWEACAVLVPENELKGAACGLCRLCWAIHLVYPAKTILPLCSAGLTEHLRTMSRDAYLSRLAACVQLAALRSDLISVQAHQALCVTAARISAALQRQSGGVPPAWSQALSTECAVVGADF